jgi:hypothetical protein
MTTGESLVSIWRNNITLEQEKAAAIDAAIAEAKREARVECADVLVRAGYEGSMVHRAILDLNAPPAPAYPFGKDATGRQCECWEDASRVSPQHWSRDDSGMDRWLPHDAAFCEICGAPRTKGS